MADLEIPERAFVSAARAHNVLDPSTECLTDRINAAIEAAAPVIVAAELRRLANKWVGQVGRPDPRPVKSILQTRTRTWWQAADELMDRANQLDPEGNTP